MTVKLLLLIVRLVIYGTLGKDPIYLALYFIIYELPILNIYIVSKKTSISVQSGIFLDYDIISI